MLEEIVKVFRQIVKTFRQTVITFGQNVSFVKDNKLSLMYVFPKKKVTYPLGARLTTRPENVVVIE